VALGSISAPRTHVSGRPKPMRRGRARFEKSVAPLGPQRQDSLAAFLNAAPGRSPASFGCKRHDQARRRESAHRTPLTTSLCGNKPLTRSTKPWEYIGLSSVGRCSALTF
jgi:hypothetical protein